MDTLVIGLDGGEKQIIQNMDMPFLNKLLDEGTQYEVSEDLWSRGWASILNGLHGRETGAFYCKPSLDGEYGFTQSFGTPGHKQANKKPIWEVAQENGYSVGMMGPPTTVPAPEVDGFFVSGAGGGYSPDGGIPEAACHPSSILDTLQEHECRWETRFGASGIRDQDEFFEELIKTVENRADAYTTLCDSHDPGFGFFVQKENVVVQNLLMSEIQSMINNGGNRKIHSQISDFYTTLDRTISEICEELNPENVVLVSDHGQAAYRHTVNLNQFLKQEGFQEPPASITSYPTSLARKAGSGLPSPVKSFIRSHFAGAVEEVAKPEVDWAKSASFSFRYIPGVYINDARFDGPVDDSEGEEKITRIISRFNNSSISDEFGLRAVEYRSEHIDAEKEELLPDIWIEHPDTMFFEAHGELVRPNEAYGKVEDFTEINRDMYTGIKGETPIVCVKDDSGKESLESDRDLTLAYELISQKLRS